MPRFKARGERQPNRAPPTIRTGMLSGHTMFWPREMLSATMDCHVLRGLLSELQADTLVRRSRMKRVALLGKRDPCE